jgi:hypothetical protein
MSGIAGQQLVQSGRYIAPEEPTPMLPVSFAHWTRIQGRVETLGTASTDHINWASMALGIAIPSGITFLGYLVGTRSTWALTVYGLTTVFSLAYAKAVMSFHGDEKRHRSENASDICDEMATLKAAHKEAVDAEAKGAAGA